MRNILNSEKIQNGGHCHRPNFDVVQFSPDNAHLLDNFMPLKLLILGIHRVLWYYLRIDRLTGSVF